MKLSKMLQNSLIQLENRTNFTCSFVLIFWQKLTFLDCLKNEKLLKLKLEILGKSIKFSKKTENLTFRTQEDL